MQSGAASRLDEAAVRQVAHLARLRLTDEEVTEYSKQLAQILEYVAKLNELDTSDVAPTAHALPIHNVFRDDQETTPWNPSEALFNAPDRQDGFFKVPKVLDQEST